MPRAQSRTIEAGPINQPAPQCFWQVLSFVGDDVRARTLRIAARMRTGDVSDEEQQAAANGFLSGMWWGDPAMTWLLPVHASMKLSVGARDGIKRTIYADVRDGEFNLPPCDIVSLEVAYWRPGDIQTSPIDISAEVADGGSLESTPLTFTAAKPHTATQGANEGINASSVYCNAPPGAYAFDIAAGIHGVIASGDNAFYGASDRTSGFVVFHDPQANMRFPPTMPIPLGAARRVYVNSTTANVEALWCPEITFYVR